jgi:hypothetical protein
MRTSARSRLAAVLVATAVAHAAFGTRPACAQESPGQADACFTAAERAQPLVKQKRLREARAELEVCARDVCPRIARTDCRDWLADVAREQPSIVIAAREVNDNQNTRDVTAVRAIIDGAIVVDKVDPRPIPIDPGVHHLRLEKPGFGPLEQNVEIREGEKARVVTFTWQTSWTPPQPPHPVELSRPTPPSVYVMGVLGLVALGVGTYFEVTGLGKRDSELQACSPLCPEAEVDNVRNIVRAGDITIGAGALFVVGAGILYLARPTVTLPRADEQAGLFGGPVPGGWVAGIRGSL